MSSMSQTAICLPASSSHETVMPNLPESWRYPYYCIGCGARFETQSTPNGHLISKDNSFDLQECANISFGAAIPFLEGVSCEAECAADDSLGTDLFNDLSDVESSSSDLWVDYETHEDDMGLEFIMWCKNLSRPGENSIGQTLNPGADHPLLNSLLKPERTQQSWFTYKELHAAQQETVRLLVLWPADHQKKRVECSLVEVSLAKGVEYHALSYSWGNNPVFDKRIDINGRVSLITRGLLSALLKLRSTTKPVILWIDALYISQKSHLESNTQVLLMSSIYGGAKSVIVWLGPVRDILDYFAAWWMTTRFGRLVNLSRSELRGMHKFLTRTWFRRIWMIQEFVLAREAHFVLGKFMFSAEHFHSALSFFQQTITLRRTSPKNEIEVFDSQTRILYIKKLFFYRERDLRPSFLQLVDEFRRFHASRPQDKIYGLLGLAAANSLLLDSAPKPDYDKPCMEIFKDWTLYFLMLYADLSVLYSCRASEEDKNYPSWVPDWRERRSTRCHFPLAHYFPGWKATKDFVARFSISPCHQMLFVEGIHLITLEAKSFTRSAFSPRSLSQDPIDAPLSDKGFHFVKDGIAKSSNGRAESHEDQVENVYRHRKWCRMVDDGRLALLPDVSRAGDIICLLFGGCTPFVLRPFGEHDKHEGHYEYIGDCYLDDCVEGEECYELNPDSTSRVQKFILH